MVLQAYFDESDKRTENGGTFVLAGYVAPAENWVNFIPDWDAKLKEKKIETFKWTKMRRRVKDNEAFYREIEKHVGHCVYTITDIGDLRRAVNDFEWPDVFVDMDKMKRKVSNPYHLAVKHTVVNLNERKKQMNLDGPIDLIFDEKTEQETVLRAFNFLKYSATPEFSNELGDISFRKDDDILPLQSADLYAGWVRKAHMDGKDLKTDHPFPWPMNKPMHGLYIYQKYDFFMREFEAVCSRENMECFKEYVDMEDIPYHILKNKQAHE